MRTSIHPLACPLLILVALLIPLAASGDFIFLKDGCTLRGKLMIEGETLRDPGGQEFWIKKLGGFYVVDDGARRVVFSKRQVSEARPDPSEREAPVTCEFEPLVQITGYTPALRTVKVEEAGAWQSHGERTMTLVNERAGAELKTFIQCMDVLTPHYLKTQGRRIKWKASYLTNELDSHTVLTVIRQHLAKKKPAMTDLERRLSIIRFCRQAGWFSVADAELQQLLHDFPQEKEGLGEQAKELRRRVNLRRLEAAVLAFKAGQPARAGQLLKDFPLGEAREVDAARAVGLQTQLKELQAKLERSKRLLTAVSKDAKDQRFLTECAAALAEIESSLTRDTCGRLDAFMLLALQEDRNRSQGKAPDLSPEQLLSLAISGWVLGNAGAESDVKNARRLWQTRQFLTRFLRTVDDRERGQLLDQYVKGEALPYDVVTQLIDLLPPPFPPAQLPQAPVDLTTDGGRGIPYRLQLPPEYHPHRSYPLLIALPNVKEQPQAMLARWSTLAAEHGYIVAVPKWADVIQEKYQGAEREQEVVPIVLRDVRRKFNVDPDRVILAGYDQSGNLAYDVGLSQPDLFAAVVVICGRPGKFGRSYKFNAQYLPFYVVEGEKSPNNSGENRDLFEHWVNGGFPSLYVEYVGRGLEFYPGELPYIFDWLGRKKRARGLPELGGPDPEGGSLGREFRSERQTDNRFYWISSDDLSVGHGRVATVTARLTPADNGVLAYQSGFRQLTVWLNSAMMDFEQPVVVRVNPGSANGKGFKGKLTPDLRIMLEDFYQRGDRRNLFVGRVDFRW